MNYFEPLLCNSYYHIYNHAVGKENLFSERENYLYFLTRFGEYISPVCRTFAYCLMPNHFHFLIRVKEEQEVMESFRMLKGKAKLAENELPDLSKFIMQQFSNFFNAYAKAYNNKYERRGALFMDYMKRKPVKTDSYFSKLVYYIHYNPVHHGFCRNVKEWEFSSFGSILSDKNSRLEKEEVLNWFGDKKQFREFHKAGLVWKPSEVEELEFL